VASVIAQVQEDTAKIRGEMGHLQRHQLRIIPELHFHLDETIDKMARIDELLKQ
jgi:ribosome-binding factor A